MTDRTRGKLLPSHVLKIVRAEYKLVDGLPNCFPSSLVMIAFRYLHDCWLVLYVETVMGIRWSDAPC